MVGLRAVLSPSYIGDRYGDCECGEGIGGIPVLITQEYLQQQQILHQRADYGTSSLRHAKTIAELLKATGSLEMLDYGAGKGLLGKALIEADYPGTVYFYDPAIPEWSTPPQPCGFVVCTDVLEHIEPDLIDDVLDDLKRVTTNYGYFAIHTGPAVKVLPDGRNAHLIQEPLSWWFPKLDSRFYINQLHRQGNGIMVYVT